MSLRIGFQVDETDAKFFELHWEEWVKQCPPPKGWTGSKREWASLEMPFIGWWGRLLWKLDMRLPPSKE